MYHIDLILYTKCSDLCIFYAVKTAAYSVVHTAVLQTLLKQSFSLEGNYCRSNFFLLATETITRNLNVYGS